MTAIFSDEFNGTSGTLNGHIPEIGFNSLSWATSDMVVNGSGFAGPSDNSNRSVYGEATYGNTNSSRGLGNTFNIEFTFKTGSVVTGYIENTGFLIDIYANGTTYSFVFGGTGDGWAAFISTQGGASDFTYPSVYPNTEYICNATISTTNVTFNFSGTNLTKAYSAPSQAIGLSGIHILVGGTCLIGYIKIYPPPSPEGILLSPIVLGLPSIIGTSTTPQTAGRISSPSPLSTIESISFTDFTTSILFLNSSIYVMDLITPDGNVRVPISSWQATLQTGSSNYIQCVVPACYQWVSTINFATEFVIYRKAVLSDGYEIEQEMARSPTEEINFDRGNTNYTCTISGYTDAFAENDDPSEIYDRTLTGIRTISIGKSSYRVRCAIDWLLRPGQRAFVDGNAFVVRYINYYAPGNDTYMDCGS